MSEQAACWIVVEDNNGTALGDGPIFRVLSWSSTAQLSKAGRINFSVAANDPRASLLAAKRVVRCYALVNNAVTEIGAGIVDKLQWVVGQDATVIQVTGDDLLRELSYRSVRDLTIYDETNYRPTRVFVQSGTAYLDVPDTYDGYYNNGGSVPATADSIDLGAQDSFLLIGHSSKFNTVWSFQGTASDGGGTYYNTFPARMNYGYSAATGWPEFDTVVDNSIVDGVPWPASLAGGSADTVFQRNAAWTQETVNGQAAYWVRFDPDADLQNVRMEEFVIGVRTPKVQDIPSIMAYAPLPAWSDWDAGTVTAGVDATTTNGTYAVFAGESVLSALTKVAKRSGENFRLGPNRQLQWLRSVTSSSGVLAVRNTGNIRQNSNTTVCVITALERIEDTYDLITRIYPYGAGMGKARVSLIHATTTMPSGYTLDRTNNYIEATAGTASYGVIERVLAFKDARSVTDQTYDTEEACDELKQLALNYLQRRDSIKQYYRLTVTDLNQLLQVGTTIRVIWQEAYNGVATLDIDGEYIILSETHAFSNGRVYTVALDVGETDSWPATDEEVIADMIEQGVIYEAHPQPIDAEMVRGVITAAATEVLISTAAATDADTLDGLDSTAFVTRATPTYAHAAKTDDYTLGTADALVALSVANKTLTLPTAAGCTGRRYTLKANQVSGTIAVAGAGAETIDGLAAQFLYPGDCLECVSSGTGWEIV